MIEYKIPYGGSEVKFQIPESFNVEILDGQFVPEIPDEEIKKALRCPIGSFQLSEIARKKGGEAVVVVSDITRPVPYKKFLPYIIKELQSAGISNNRIAILVATGVHRDNSKEEMIEMFGHEIVNKIRIVNHSATNDKDMVDLGKTRSDLPVIINRLFAEADIKILTGLIDLHQTAGFSGGRKSVVPGIASHKLIRIHHSFPFRSRQAVLGKLKQNLFHQSAMEAAKIVGVDFMVNVVTNSRKRIVKVVAGDLESAWLEGVKVCRRTRQIPISQRFDVVITSPGGYPRDIDLYQSQKALSPAESATYTGGNTVLVAECRDGLGGKTDTYSRWLREGKTPAEVMERFEREGWTEASSKAYMFARALHKFKITVVTENIEPKLLNNMFFDHASTMEEAIDRVLKGRGISTRICILPHASSIGISCKNG